MDHLTELRGRIATLLSRRAELGQQSAGYAARTDLTAEDRTAWDGVRTQITEIDADVARLNGAIEQEEEGLRQAARQPAPTPAVATPPAPSPNVDPNAPRALRMMGSRHGEDGRRQLIDVPAYRNPAARAWFQQLRSDVLTNGDFRFEARAFQADSATEGGYLSQGEQFVMELIQAVDNQTFIRQRATVRQVAPGFTSLGAPSLDTDAEDSDWTTELLVGNEEDSIRFGRRSLTPHPLAKWVKESRELLRAAAMDAEGIILGRMAYKFGITQEKGFLTGNGAQQPLGLFIASNDGISTARDVSTGNETTSITTDGIIEAQYTLKAAYWPRATWLFHRDAVKQIAKLKDGEGRYLWEPSIRQGDPDQLRGFPMLVSEYVPNTFTTGLYVGLFGDLSYYWIADSLDMTMQRLVELFAATNQIGFIGRLQTDGMPVLEEAFVRVKLA